MAKRAKKKGGPKPKFLDIPCPNPTCQQYGKKGLGNVVSNGRYRTRSTGKARLFLCRTCGKAFSSRSGTVFFGLRSPRTKVLKGLRLLVAGRGIRATSRVLKIKPDTIRRWLATATLHREQVSTMLVRDLNLSKVQVDRLWTFVILKTKIPIVIKTPKSHGTDHPQSPLIAKKGQG